MHYLIALWQGIRVKRLRSDAVIIDLLRGRVCKDTLDIATALGLCPASPRFALQNGIAEAFAKPLKLMLASRFCPTLKR